MMNKTYFFNNLLILLAFQLFLPHLSFSQSGSDELECRVLYMPTEDEFGRVEYLFTPNISDTLVFYHTQWYSCQPDFINQTNIRGKRNIERLLPGESFYNTFTNPEGEYSATIERDGRFYICHFNLFNNGCTDPSALNYHMYATIDDDSCEFEESACAEITTIYEVHPDCGYSDGKISVNASGSNLQYRLNSGAWQESSLFENLPEGNYTVRARNSSTNCQDSRNIELDCEEEQICPRISRVNIVHQPSTCGIDNGQIWIDASGSSNEYSIDNGQTWQSWDVFTDLAPGRYFAYARNTETQCRSNRRIFDLSCAPSCSDGVKNGTETQVDCGGTCAPCCPEDISVRVLNYPYCPSGREGQIRISARGVDLEYSINNGQSYRSSPVFGNRIGNRNLNIAVRSKKTGCVRKLLRYYLPCAEPCPAITQVSLSEPHCETPNSGSIRIQLGEGQGNLGINTFSRPNGSNGVPTYEYSIDNGMVWQGRPVFQVGAGTYNILVRNNETDCTRGQQVSLSCFSCYDGKRNGDEEEVDCGGEYCHSCECPTVEDIKQSLAAQQGPQGGSGGVGEATTNTFICDLPEYFECPECASFRSCFDDIDNDGDQLCDCEDPGCQQWYDEICEKETEQCSDGIDNDQDGVIDCFDFDCFPNFNCAEDFSDQLGRSTLTHDRSDLVLALYYNYNITEFISEHGIPHWNRSLKINDTEIIPIAPLGSLEMHAMIVVMNNDQYNFISTNDLLNSIRQLNNNAINTNSSLSRELIEVLAKLQLFGNRSLNGGQNIEIAKFIQNSNAPKGLNKLDPPEEENDYCTYSCTDISVGEIEVIEVDGVVEGASMQVDRGRYYLNATGVTCNFWIKTCFPSDTSPLHGNQIGFGGSEFGSSSFNNEPAPASQEFMDRIRLCSLAGSQNSSEHETDAGFCRSIEKLFDCDKTGRIGNDLSWRTIELLYNAKETVYDSETDDEGHINEAAELLCDAEGGEAAEVANLLEEFINYAALNGWEDLISIEEFQILSEFLDEEEIDMTEGEFISLFREEECLTLMNRSSINSCFLFDSEDKECINIYKSELAEYGVTDFSQAHIACQKLSELLDIITNDPYAFFTECFDENDPNSVWSDLLSFSTPEFIRETIEQRASDGSWFVHDLDDARGPLVNADFYSVNFGNNGLAINGVTADPQTFFEHIRDSFTDFDDNCNSEFRLNKNSSNQMDEEIWNSEDPTGAVVDIDIIFTDDAAVVVSDFNNDMTTGNFNWTFTTISTPFEMTGDHPVSGHRQFGLVQNDNGEWIFYTRGLDRATSVPRLFSRRFSNFGFDMGGNLWECLMDNVSQALGGEVESLEPHRVDWEFVKDQLLDLPVSELLKCTTSD